MSDDATERVFDYDAFISHASGDGSGRLAAQLGRFGVSVWHDQAQDMSDARWRGRLTRSLLASRFVIAYVGPSSDPGTRPWFAAEIQAALDTEGLAGIPRVLVAREPSAGIPTDLVAQPYFIVPEDVRVLAEVVIAGNRPRAPHPAAGPEPVRAQEITRLKRVVREATARALATALSSTASDAEAERRFLHLTESASAVQWEDFFRQLSIDARLDMCRADTSTDRGDKVARFIAFAERFCSLDLSPPSLVWEMLYDTVLLEPLAVASTMPDHKAPALEVYARLVDKLASAVQSDLLLLKERRARATVGDEGWFDFLGAALSSYADTAEGMRDGPTTSDGGFVHVVAIRIALDAGNKRRRARAVLALSREGLRNNPRPTDPGLVDIWTRWRNPAMGRYDGQIRDLLTVLADPDKKW